MAERCNNRRAPQCQVRSHDIRCQLFAVLSMIPQVRRYHRESFENATLTTVAQEPLNPAQTLRDSGQPTGRWIAEIRKQGEICNAARRYLRVSMVAQIGVVKNPQPGTTQNSSLLCMQAKREVHLLHAIRHCERDVTSRGKEGSPSVNGGAPSKV